VDGDWIVVGQDRTGQDKWWSGCECSTDRMGAVTGLLWDRAGQDRWWSGCECSTDRMGTVTGLLRDRTGQMVELL